MILKKSVTYGKYRIPYYLTLRVDFACAIIDHYTGQIWPDDTNAVRYWCDIFQGIEGKIGDLIDESDCLRISEDTMYVSGNNDVDKSDDARLFCSI